MQWNESYGESVYAFANTINTHEGGTHEEGFRAALTSIVNKYGADKKLLKGDEKLTGEDIREGLAAIVSVKLVNPQFEGQTKTKLGNTDMKGFVQKVCNEWLADWFERNPGEAKTIITKANAAARARTDWLHDRPGMGNYRRTVGILSASLIGRRVIELLRPYDFGVLLHDPHVTAEEAGALGVRLVPLDELFAECDVVSVHTPLLPETRGLVSGQLIGAMRQDATLVNTARGAVLDQDALTEAVRAGRIRAVLDVTEPEVLPREHPLWDCENAFITPHIAGSLGNELRRLADLTVSEVARWARGEGFAHPVRRERLAYLA